MRSFATSLVVVSLASVGISCGSSSPGRTPAGGAAGGIGGRGGQGGPGGTPVTVTDPAAQAKTIAELRAAIAADRPADAAGFATRWSTKYATGLPYDPLQAQGF